MEVNTTQKYTKDLLNNKIKKHLKTTKSGPFFEGAVKFRFLATNSYTKKIEISFWLKNDKEPIFIAKELFLFTEDSTFTFEPINLQVGLNL